MLPIVTVFPCKCRVVRNQIPPAATNTQAVRILSFTMKAPGERRSRAAIRETMVRPLAAVGACGASIWYGISWTKIRVLAQNDECCLWQDPQQRKGETVHVC